MGIVSHSRRIAGAQCPHSVHCFLACSVCLLIRIAQLETIERGRNGGWERRDAHLWIKGSKRQIWWVGLQSCRFMIHGRISRPRDGRRTENLQLDRLISIWLTVGYTLSLSHTYRKLSAHWKSKSFLWLIEKNTVLTWPKLQERGCLGPIYACRAILARNIRCTFC